MKIKIPENPLSISLPPKVELALFLIKAELKNLKTINVLHKKRVDAAAGLFDFSALILEILGFDNNAADEFNEWYFKRQNKLVEKIDPGEDKELSLLAMNFYLDLLAKKHECNDRNN